MTINTDHQAELSAALLAEKAAADKVARISSSKRSVAARLEDLRTQAESTIELAESAEREAADEVALAVANGVSAEALKKTESRLADAARALVNARQKAGEGSGLLGALEAQAASLDSQLEAANGELENARNQAQAVRRSILSARWNAAVDDLAAIGAELLDVLPERGFFALKDMRVPVFGRPSRHMGRNELLELRGYARPEIV